MAKTVKEFHKYLCDATISHMGLNDYLKSPATAFLKYTIEAKSAINLSASRFKKNDDGSYSSDSYDSLQYLSSAILPTIMGHFETFQKILFSRMFDFSVYLKDFDIAYFIKELENEKSIIDLNRLSAYRNIGTSSIGILIADSLNGWHSPEKVNSHFDKFRLKTKFFSNKDIDRLKVLWQLRHSIVHTGGTLTLPDAQKVKELKKYGGKVIAFDKNFINEVARKMHPMIKDSMDRIGKKYIENLVPTITIDKKEEIEKLFEVKSSNNAWLK